MSEGHNSRRGSVVQCFLVTDDDHIFRDEIVTDKVNCNLRIGCHYLISLLQGQTDAMMVEMPLEPVIWIIPVTDEREILNLNDSASVLVCVLFHIVNLYSANLVKFVPVAILKQ